jgi:cyanophycin synthetase
MQARLQIERIIARIRKLLVDRLGLSRQVYFHHRVQEYRNMWREVARAMGAEFTELAEDLWEFKKNGAVTRILNHQLELDNPVILGMAGRKPLIHKLLSRRGIPVPPHLTFHWTQIDKARAFLGRYPAGCVIKPAVGYGGQGVTTHVKIRQEIKKAAILASLYYPELIIEPMIAGESYRLLVIGGRMVHAVCRRGPRLIGDGESTVRSSVARENARRKDANEPILEIDRDMEFTLGYQGLSLASVPSVDQEVILKSINDRVHKTTEVRTVYNTEVTGLICPSIVRTAEETARILGSDLLGVDIIMTDPTLPLEATGGVINEVNTTPAMHHHYDSAGDERFPSPALQALSLILERSPSTDAVTQREVMG